MYITTAISYPNGDPHIGHAYEIIAADVARRAYAVDQATRLLTGTDEHGLKIAQRAAELGITPKQLVDQASQKFVQMVAAVDAHPDRFIRTTDIDHIVTAKFFWTKLFVSGHIYLGNYSGWYSVADEAFVDDKDLTVVDGLRFTAEGREAKWVEEQCWFFRLTDFEEQLKVLLAGDFVYPVARANEMRSLLNQGLRDIAISRTTFDWGVPVPSLPEGHVMYVWVDALVNYITGADGHWPADVHLIGKDILKFHALLWPAFLIATGHDLPRKIIAHGFLLHEGRKMSKTEGNVVDPIEQVERYGSDQLRYYLLTLTTFGNDGDYSEAGLIEKVNCDLANAWGNLVSRVGSICAKLGYWPSATLAPSEIQPKVKALFENFRFVEGIQLWLERIATLNARVGDERLWEPGNDGALGEIIEAIGDCNRAIDPIIPNSRYVVSEWLAQPVPTKPVPLFKRIEQI